MKYGGWGFPRRTHPLPEGFLLSPGRGAFYFMGWVGFGGIMILTALESSPFRPAASLPLHQMERGKASYLQKNRIISHPSPLGGEGLGLGIPPSSLPKSGAFPQGGNSGDGYGHARILPPPACGLLPLHRVEGEMRRFYNDRGKEVTLPHSVGKGRGWGFPRQTPQKLT